MVFFVSCSRGAIESRSFFVSSAVSEEVVLLGAIESRSFLVSSAVSEEVVLLGAIESRRACLFCSSVSVGGDLDFEEL
jgi:hypothetical protein